MKTRLSTILFAFFVCAAFVLASSTAFAAATAEAATAAQIDLSVDIATKKLYTTTPTAKELSKVAKGVVVFPDIVKGGFIIGGQYGVGAFREDGKTLGYYNTAAGTFGLQIGLQKYGYAMFLMTDNAMDYFKKRSGWEFGVGPTVVVVDAGIAGALTTTTAKEDIYVFFFDQKGLMVGLNLEGAKISKIEPDK